MVGSMLESRSLLWRLGVGESLMEQLVSRALAEHDFVQPCIPQPDMKRTAAIKVAATCVASLPNRRRTAKSRTSDLGENGSRARSACGAEARTDPIVAWLAR